MTAKDILSKTYYAIYIKGWHYNDRGFFLGYKIIDGDKYPKYSNKKDEVLKSIKVYRYKKNAEKQIKDIAGFGDKVMTIKTTEPLFLAMLN
jgi:hypothetical protein